VGIFKSKKPTEAQPASQQAEPESLTISMDLERIRSIAKSIENAGIESSGINLDIGVVEYMVKRYEDDSRQMPKELLENILSVLKAMDSKLKDKNFIESNKDVSMLELARRVGELINTIEKHLKEVS